MVVKLTLVVGVAILGQMQYWFDGKGAGEE